MWEDNREEKNKKNNNNNTAGWGKCVNAKENEMEGETGATFHVGFSFLSLLFLSFPFLSGLFAPTLYSNVKVK